MGGSVRVTGTGVPFRPPPSAATHFVRGRAPLHASSGAMSILGYCSLDPLQPISRNIMYLSIFDNLFFFHPSRIIVATPQE